MENTQFQRIECTRQNDILIVTLKDEQVKEWDQSQAIRDELVRAIGQTKSPRVILNMANVKFLASCGFLPLVSVNGTVNNAGGKLIICGLSDFVKKVLSTTQMLINPKISRGVFDERATMADAIAALS